MALFKVITKVKTGLRALLPENAFARGVSVLVGGTAGAQAFTILVAPLLTRLYTPEDFGLVAVYGSLLALIGVVASLHYELAIPLPEDDQTAANVVVLSLLIVIGATLLSALVVILFGVRIVHALGVPVGETWSDPPRLPPGASGASTRRCCPNISTAVLFVQDEWGLLSAYAEERYTRDDRWEVIPVSQ